MNIYAIHKFENHNLVERIAQEIKSQIFDVAFCQLTNASKYWKRKTKTIMKKTDMAVYFVGQKISENVLWEIALAEKYGVPVYLVKLDEKVDLLDSKFIQLYKSDGYTNEKRLGYKLLSNVELFDLVKAKDAALRKKLFENNLNDSKTTVEQYKLMLSTSESLIERRQKITNVYIGVCGILLPIATASLASANLFIIACAAVVCLIICLLCVSWIKMITDYGNLNAAKFEIIEEIERKLPLSIFGAEWVALSRRTKKYVSFTQREKFLPKIFIGLSCIIFVIFIIIFILRIIKVIA